MPTPASSAIARAVPELPEGLKAKFEQARAELRGERRQVAVLFADIQGFTALSERLDPEEVTVLLNALLRRLADVVYEYEGYVDKFIGDAIMALFGAPIAHENDAERAVLTGLGMLEVLADQNRGSDVPLALRVGINLGEVIAAQLGTEMQLQYTVLGDAVNLASRLEGAAEPNTILVSEAVHERLADRIEAVPVSPLELKGKSEPVPAWRVTGYRAPRERGGREESPFVGREDEVARIEELFARAAAGDGGAILIEGEAGSGKTRLAREALRRAWAGRRLVEIGFTPVRVPGQRPAPAALFCALLGEDPSAVLDRAREILGDDIERHLSGVQGLAVEAFPKSELEPPPPTDPQSARQNRWIAAAALLERVARSDPTGILLEDVHWADESELEFLTFTFATVRAAPIAALLTTRPLTDETVRALPTGLERLELGALGSDAATRLLEGLMGDVPPERRRELVQRSAGNPLFLEELIRAVREGDGGGDGPGAVPETLKGLVTSRIDRLSGPHKLLLQMAAVLGTRFATPLLERMYALEPHPVGFDEALAELERGGFLTVDHDGTSAFRHQLLQGAAYSGLLHRLRRVLHESAARIGEEVFADRIESEAEFFAHHYWCAGAEDRAAPHLWAAGRRAARAYDLPTAERYLLRVAQVVRERPETLPEDAERARFVETLGDVLLHRGDLDAADEWFRRLERLGAEGDRPVWRARGAELRGRAAWYRGRLDEAEALFAEGLDLLPAGEDRYAADLHNDIGVVHYYRGRVDDAFAAHSAALKLREASGDRLGTSKSLLNIGNVLMDLRNDLEGAERHYRRAHDEAEAIGDRQMRYSALNNLGRIQIERGEWERAIETFVQADRLLEDIGWPFARFVTLQNRSECLIALGRIDEALRHLEVCLEQGDDVLEPVNRVRTRLSMFDAYLKSMDEERAESAIADARRVVEELDAEEEIGQLLLREGRWSAVGGRWDRAAERFADAEAAARERSHVTLEALAAAHRWRARVRSAEAAGDGSGAGPHHADAAAGPIEPLPQPVLLAYLAADGAAAREPTAGLAERLESVAAAAAGLGDVALERAAAERSADVRRAIGDAGGERRAVGRAVLAMERLAERLPPELRQPFLDHPRNAGLRGRAGEAQKR